MQTLPEISAGLQQTFVQVRQAIERGKGLYLDKPTEKWSIAEQFDHLIRSNKPVCGALALPEAQLAAMGQPDQPTRSFDELKRIYYDELAKGVKATGRFIPEAKLDRSAEQVVGEWLQIGDAFQMNLSQWSEDPLDKYVLRHPVLGNLTIREMLFFTIFHNQHHLNKINELIDGHGTNH